MDKQEALQKIQDKLDDPTITEIERQVLLMSKKIVESQNA